MAAKPINKNTSESIIADWRTGAYSQQKLADKYAVSKGVVNKLCKGIEQDMTAIVTAGVQYRQGLADHDDRIVTAVTDVVDERTKHIQFFNNITVKNIQVMGKKLDETISIAEHKFAQEAIQKGRETVLGKTPDTAIQINNTQVSTHKLDDLTDEQLATIATGCG
jgi:hypothetical protein